MSGFIVCQYVFIVICVAAQPTPWLSVLLGVLNFVSIICLKTNFRHNARNKEPRIIILTSPNNWLLYLAMVVSVLAGLVKFALQSRNSHQKST